MICHGRSWGRVRIRNVEAATVVCRQLGFSAEGMNEFIGIPS